MAFRQIIDDNYRTLLRCLDPTNEFLGSLRSVTFVKDRVSFIKQQETLDDKNDALLTALREVPDGLQESVMNDFLSALRCCGQEHVANIFTPESDKVPMSEEHRSMLVKQTAELVKFLDPEIGLLDSLLSSGVITSVDVDRIRKKVGFPDMARELLSTIQKKSDDAFQALINSLIETGQSHVVYILTGKGEHVADILIPESLKVPMSDEHRNMIIEKTDELRKFLDPENGLLSILFSVKVISVVDEPRIRNKVGLDEMAKELLSTILRKSDDAFQALIDSLNNTGQSHVVFILRGKGFRQPVSDNDRKRLRERREKLLHCIIPADLVSPLVSKGVFTSSDQQRVEGRKVTEEKVETMLDLIARKSQTAFDHFIEVLRQCNHEHAAEWLMGPEVAGTVEVSVEDSEVDVQNLEGEIREDMPQTLAGDETELKRELIKNGLSVPVILEGSIIVKFRYEDHAALVSLQKFYSSKTLDQLFTDAFLPKFADKGLKSLRVVIAEEEFQRHFELKLMTDDHRNTLKSLAEHSFDKVTVSDEFLDKLSLCEPRRKAVKEQATREQQVKALLDVVSRQPDSAFTQFLNALDDTQQTEAASYLRGFEGAEVDDRYRATASVLGEKSRKYLYSYICIYHH